MVALPFKWTAFEALGRPELPNSDLGFCPVELMEDGVSIHSFGGGFVQDLMILMLFVVSRASCVLLTFAPFCS